MLAAGNPAWPLRQGLTAVTIGSGPRTSPPGAEACRACSLVCPFFNGYRGQQQPTCPVPVPLKLVSGPLNPQAQARRSPPPRHPGQRREPPPPPHSGARSLIGWATLALIVNRARVREPRPFSRPIGAGVTVEARGARASANRRRPSWRRRSPSESERIWGAAAGVRRRGARAGAGAGVAPGRGREGGAPGLDLWAGAASSSSARPGVGPGEEPALAARQLLAAQVGVCGRGAGRACWRWFRDRYNGASCGRWEAGPFGLVERPLPPSVPLAPLPPPQRAGRARVGAL